MKASQFIQRKYVQSQEQSPYQLNISHFKRPISQDSQNTSKNQYDNDDDGISDQFNRSRILKLQQVEVNLDQSINKQIALKHQQVYLDPSMSSLEQENKVNCFTDESYINTEIQDDSLADLDKILNNQDFKRPPHLRLEYNESFVNHIQPSIDQNFPQSKQTSKWADILKDSEKNLPEFIDSRNDIIYNKKSSTLESHISHNNTRNMSVILGQRFKNEDPDNDKDRVDQKLTYHTKNNSIARQILLGSTNKDKSEFISPNIKHPVNQKNSPVKQSHQKQESDQSQLNCQSFSFENQQELQGSSFINISKQAIDNALNISSSNESIAYTNKKTLLQNRNTIPVANVESPSINIYNVLKENKNIGNKPKMLKPRKSINQSIQKQVPQQKSVLQNLQNIEDVSHLRLEILNLNREVLEKEQIMIEKDKTIRELRENLEISQKQNSQLERKVKWYLEQVQKFEDLLKHKNVQSQQKSINQDFVKAQEQKIKIQEDKILELTNKLEKMQYEQELEQNDKNKAPIEFSIPFNQRLEKIKSNTHSQTSLVSQIQSIMTPVNNRSGQQTEMRFFSDIRQNPHHQYNKNTYSSQGYDSQMYQQNQNVQRQNGHLRCISQPIQIYQIEPSHINQTLSSNRSNNQYSTTSSQQKRLIWNKVTTYNQEISNLANNKRNYSNNATNNINKMQTHKNIYEERSAERSPNTLLNKTNILVPRINY
ncbi:UNKNOWN [Stylonychia lemnae]|uniref:Uncharacterized protein n=1 Tax=Stylonychia lemnae TaxID=5949 RepID=A0A078B0M7_STYLE|nr:UNKNOWN [Stylonychia lemnae]|eukprot:CDW87856.1 UNKNOWN [Stylonychia lemnae]